MNVARHDNVPDNICCRIVLRIHDSMVLLQNGHAFLFIMLYLQLCLLFSFAFHCRA